MQLIFIVFALAFAFSSNDLRCEEVGRTDGNRDGFARSGKTIAPLLSDAFVVAQSSQTTSRGVRMSPRQEPVSRSPAPHGTKASASVLPPIVGDRELFELTVWKIVRASKDPADFEAYLNMFPKGRFAERARGALGVLRTEPSNADEDTNARARARNSASPSYRSVEQNLNLPLDDRVRIQKSLNAMTYGAGREDGAFGPVTRAAIRRYQGAMEFPVTGYLTSDQATVLVELGRSITSSKQVETVTSADRIAPKSSEQTASQTSLKSPVDTRIASIHPAKPPAPYQEGTGGSDAPATTPPQAPPIRFAPDRHAIEEAIIEYIIDVGSNNCWGDIYFCFLYEIVDTKFGKSINNSITVVSEYTLISSYSLEGSSDKRKFISEFVLLKFSGQYKVISIKTVKLSNSGSGGSSLTEPAE